jgi:hypothetical protein
MAQRHKDADLISKGASNPIAIANAIVRACKEVQDECGSTATDSAIHLMVHQLAYITETSRVDSLTGYRVATDYVEKLAAKS